MTYEKRQSIKLLMQQYKRISCLFFQVLNENLVWIWDCGRDGIYIFMTSKSKIFARPLTAPCMGRFISLPRHYSDWDVMVSVRHRVSKRARLCQSHHYVTKQDLSSSAWVRLWIGSCLVVWSYLNSSYWLFI